MKLAWRFAPMGEAAVLVEAVADLDVYVGDRAQSGLINRYILALAPAVEGLQLPGAIIVVPAITSILVRYDPLVLTRCQLQQAIRALLPGLQPAPANPEHRVEMPVRFGGEHGPDLDEAARALELPPSRIVAELCGRVYRVMMIGFAQGFPYLGPLPANLALPRRATPRLSVPAGSVAIAGGMAGIYPVALPGGWHLVGRTDARLFNPDDETQPALLRAGDGVVFVAVN